MPRERANAQPGERSLLPPAPHPSSSCSSSAPHTQTSSHPLPHSHTQTHARTHAPHTHSTLSRALTPLSPCALAGAALRGRRTPLPVSLCNADSAGGGCGGGNRSGILPPGRGPSQDARGTPRRRSPMNRDLSIPCQQLTASGSRWTSTPQPFRDGNCDSPPPRRPQCRFRGSFLETRSKDGTATALKYV